VTTEEHRLRASQVRDWLSTLRESEDLLSVGAYTPGANPRIDAAIDRRESINRLLCQSADIVVRYSDAVDALKGL
jgi:flagellar biosynthesis/type III secretory pathway ATPase